MKRKPNLPKLLLQWGVLLALAGTILRAKLSGEGVDVEAYCPFGGLQAFGSYLARGSLACSMSMLQIAMGLALAAGVVLLAKLFCGYLCPVGTVVGWLGGLGRRLGLRRELRAGGAADRLLRGVKYALLFVVFYFTLSSSELFCHKLDPYYAVATGFEGEIVLWMSLVMLVVLLAGSLCVGMFWCRYLCPLGAASNLFRRWPLLLAAALAAWALGAWGVPRAWLWVLVLLCGGGALCDEQSLVPDAISQLNSMYFDEIYHGRTGYEMLHAMSVYETTHPPLGKVFIMLGIAVFGMNGFGWRVAGALFGAAMVPLFYLLGRRLTRRPWLALVGAALFGLDFMRFTQSRIATIDVYVTFFILLGAYCMLWYAQTVLQKGVRAALLPMALGGLAFGLGCASKWTGIYAGAGLAVVYFWVLYARWRQQQPGFGREAALAIGGGVAFFVAVPLLVYLASYLPYLWRDPSFGLGDWWQCQVSMYQYHSQLVATHAFESRWYTWPLMLRPVWYYMGSGLPQGAYASIAVLGNPVVWWGGLAALLAVGRRILCGKGSRRGAFVGVLFLAQLLPWVLVTRCTFLYHYFPALGFTLLALLLWLARLERRRPALAHGLAIGMVALAAVLFVWFYPVLAGVPVSEGWARSLLWVPSWGFYILP